MCTCVCQIRRAGLEAVFRFSMRLTSLWVRVSEYSTLVMQVLTPVPSSTSTLPYCPSINCLCHLFPSIQYVIRHCEAFSHNSSAFNSSFPSTLSLKRAFESGVPGRAQLSETVGFMTRRRGFPPGDRVQSEQGFFKGQS